MDTVNRASEWGIKASGEPDWSAVKAFEDAIVDKLVKGVTGLIKARKIDVVHGHRDARGGPGRRGRRAARSTPATSSSRPAPVPSCCPGIEIGERIITSDQALWYDSHPVVGRRDRRRRGRSGVRIALPLVRRRGHADRGASPAGAARGRGDLEGGRPGVPQARHRERRGRFRAAGQRHGRPRRGHLRRQAGTKTVSADICLVAVGRGPVTDDLGLDQAGVSLHEKGFVNVDGQLRTNVEHVWAVGDVAATPLQLAHVVVHRGIRGRRAHRRAWTCRTSTT